MTTGAGSAGLPDGAAAVEDDPAAFAAIAANLHRDEAQWTARRQAGLTTARAYFSKDAVQRELAAAMARSKVAEPRASYSSPLLAQAPYMLVV